MWPFKPNDWYPVWTDTSKFTVKYITGGSGPDEFVSYEILWSPCRKAFKLSCKGKDYKKHSLYKIAVQKLNEFINNQKST